MQTPVSYANFVAVCVQLDAAGGDSTAVWDRLVGAASRRLPAATPEAWPFVAHVLGDDLPGVLAEALAFEQAVRRLMAMVEEVTDDDEVLDDLVHDVCGREGSDCNNAGLEPQVRALLADLGEEEAWTVIAEQLEMLYGDIDDDPDAPAEDG